MREKLHWKALARHLKTLPQKRTVNLSDNPVCVALSNETSADIALAMEELPPEQAVNIFLTLGHSSASEVLSMLEPGLSKKILAELPADSLANILNSLPPRDAATLVTEAPKKQINAFIKHKLVKPVVVREVESRLDYPKGSAGRLMTTQFISLHAGTTVADAINEIRKTDPKVDIPEDFIYCETGKKPFITPPVAGCDFYTRSTNG